MYRKTKLTLWVESQGGAIALAKKLKITPHCIRVWMRGEGWPTVEMGRKLVLLSKGRLTPRDIFECSGGKLRC